jgi:hypothetical protein
MTDPLYLSDADETTSGKGNCHEQDMNHGDSSTACGRNQNVFSRQDAKSAKKMGQP